MRLLKAKTVRDKVPQSCHWAHQKIDGIRVSLEMDEQGVLRVMTTTPHDISRQVKANSWYLNALRGMLPGSVIEGELYAPGERASEVKSWLAKNELLSFSAFAVPWWEGVEHFGAPLELIHQWCDIIGIRFAPYEKIKDQTAHDLLYKARQLGLEGWVLKEANYRGWFKLKVESTIDCVVTGFVEGKGKYICDVGALIVSVEGVEIARAGGFTDAVRFEIDEKQDLGRVCEIKYQYVGSKGRLRHPRFVRWRDDKPASACILAQDETLKEYWDDRRTEV